MLRKIQTGSFETRFSLQHSVARFFCAAGFRNHDNDCAVQLIVDLVEDAVEAIWISVVEKVNAERIFCRAERISDEFWPQCRAADANGKNVLKFFFAAVFNFSAMDIGREFLDARIGRLYLATQVSVRREVGFAQPVVADHSLFVRIRNFALFQTAHRRERLVDLRPHFLEEIVRKFHPADVDRETEIVVAKKVLLKALPERRGSHKKSVTSDE